MNERLRQVIAEIESLPDDRQSAAAEVLLDFVRQEQGDIFLTPGQVAEIERRAASEGPYATESEVHDTFSRLTK